MCFPSTPKPKAGIFKFLRFDEHFQKAPIGVDGRRNHKLRFQISARSARLVAA